jgi:hypothetical protein
MAGPPPNNRKGPQGGSRPSTPQKNGRQGGGVRKRVAAGPVGDVKLQIGRLKRLLEQVPQPRRSRSGSCCSRAAASPGSSRYHHASPAGRAPPARPLPAIARPACPRRDAAPAGRPEGALPPAQAGGARGRARQAGGAAAGEEVLGQVPQGQCCMQQQLRQQHRALPRPRLPRPPPCAASAARHAPPPAPRPADQVCGPHQDGAADQAAPEGRRCCCCRRRRAERGAGSAAGGAGG